MREVLIEKIPPPHESDEFKDVWFDKKGKVKRLKKRDDKGMWYELFFKNGILDGGIDNPCSFGCNGYLAYYTKGKLHRGIFEPAEIFPDGRKKYYVYGELRFEVNPNRIAWMKQKQNLSDTILKLYSMIEDGVN